MIYKTINYGKGGYDPKRPNGNVVSVDEVEVPDAPLDPMIEQLREQASKVSSISDVKAVLDAVLDHLQEAIG